MEVERKKKKKRRRNFRGEKRSPITRRGTKQKLKAMEGWVTHTNWLGSRTFLNTLLTLLIPSPYKKENLKKQNKRDWWLLLIGSAWTQRFGPIFSFDCPSIKISRVLYHLTVYPRPKIWHWSRPVCNNNPPPLRWWNPIPVGLSFVKRSISTSVRQ